MEDEDYLVYLERLASDDMGANEREMDFDYENFLHHVREDGKSYVFESVDPHTGLPISVKYESYLDDPPTTTNDRSNVGRRRSNYENKAQNLFNSDGGGDGVVRGGKHAGVEGEALYDESYKYFISRAMMHGESVILDLGDDRFVEYERRDHAGANADNDGCGGVCHCPVVVVVVVILCECCIVCCVCVWEMF